MAKTKTVARPPEEPLAVATVEHSELPPETTETPVDMVFRSMVVDVHVQAVDREASRAMRDRVVTSIRNYRKACEQAYGTLLAMQAAASEPIIKEEDGLLVIKPDNARAKKLLSFVFDKSGKAFGYEMRNYVLTSLLPTVKSFVWDSLLRDVVTAWKKKDPLLGVSHGWLALQAAAGVASFRRRGIGFPQATAAPKMITFESTKDNGKILSLAGLKLDWDRDIGPVEFVVNRLDSARRIVWTMLRDNKEGWKRGTLYLKEKDGRKLQVVMTYSRKPRLADLDPSRVLNVTFEDDPANFIRMRGPIKGMTDSISAIGILGTLDQLRARRDAMEARRASYGSPTRPWGYKEGWEDAQKLVAAVTEKRVNVASLHNHIWAKRICSRAEAWRCGSIHVDGLPYAVLFGREWAWSEFLSAVQYKAEDLGAKTTARLLGPPKAEGQPDPVEEPEVPEEEGVEI